MNSRLAIRPAAGQIAGRLFVRQSKGQNKARNPAAVCGRRSTVYNVVANALFALYVKRSHIV